MIRHPATILCAYLSIFFFSVTLLPLLRRPSRYWDSALSLLAHGTAVAALWIVTGFDAAFFGLLLPMMMAAALGGYLYVQHSFPGMRILPNTEWTTYRAALVSSSYLRLGPVLRWFKGNIGFHHVHRLNSLIPFYRLPHAMAAIPELQHPSVTTLKPRECRGVFPREPVGRGEPAHGSLPRRASVTRCRQTRPMTRKSTRGCEVSHGPMTIVIGWGSCRP